MRIISLIALIAVLTGCTSTSRLRFDSNYTKHRANICDVHGCEMSKARVPIYYGTRDFWSEKRRAEQEAMRVSFPHARPWVLGGCVSSPSHPRAHRWEEGD
jgi:hypothetical protein